MALTDISAGNYTRVKIGTQEINHIESISGLSAESTIISVNHYGAKYSRSLVGSSSCGPVELVLSYVPDDAGQIALNDAIEDGEVVQITVEFMPNSNPSATAGTTLTFNALVGSKSIDTPYDGQRTVTYSLAVDGAIAES